MPELTDRHYQPSLPPPPHGKRPDVALPTPELNLEIAIEDIFERHQTKRHLISVLATRLERQAEKSGTKERLDELLTDVERQHLTPRDLERLERYFQNFRDNFRDRVAQEKTIVASTKGAGNERAAREKQLGEVLLNGIITRNQRAAFERTGKVYGLRRKHYFVLLFEQRSDYLQASYWDTSGGEHYRDIPIRFMRHPDSQVVEYNGVPIILVSHAFTGGTAANELRLDEIVRHEEAHAITSRVFNNFQETESAFDALLPSLSSTAVTKMSQIELADLRQRRDTVDTAARAIKDEVLAYCKGNRTGDSLAQTINTDPLYKNLFEPLRSKDKSRLHDCVAKVGAALDVVLAALRACHNPGDEAPNEYHLRDIVYYQLVDVPLELMPQWLQAMGRYYNRQANEMLHSRWLTLPKPLSPHIRFDHKRQTIAEAMQRDYAMMVEEKADPMKKLWQRGLTLSNTALRLQYNRRSWQLEIHQGCLAPYIEDVEVRRNKPQRAEPLQPEPDTVTAALAEATTDLTYQDISEQFSAIESDPLLIGLELEPTNVFRAKFLRALETQGSKSTKVSLLAFNSDDRSFVLHVRGRFTANPPGYNLSANVVFHA